MLYNFTLLNLNEKLKKIKYIIEQISFDTDILNNIIESLDNNQYINEEFLIGIYTDIIDFYHAANYRDENLAEQSILNIKDKMKQLKNIEKEDRDNELSDIEKQLNIELL